MFRWNTASLLMPEHDVGLEDAVYVDTEADVSYQALTTASSASETWEVKALDPFR